MGPAPLMEAQNVSIRRGDALRIIDANLEIRPGTLTGLIGPNGAGKSTLLRAMAGLLPVAYGTITLLGKPLPAWSLRERAARLAYLAQERVVGWDLTVRRIVELGRLPYADRQHPPGAGAVMRALEQTGTSSLGDRRISTLSGGEQARVLLARALAVGAPVLLADEPTAGLDPGYQIDTMELLRAEARRGVAVVTVIHDLPLASRYCDSLILLAAGRIMERQDRSSGPSPQSIADVFGVTTVAVEKDEIRCLLPWQRTRL